MELPSLQNLQVQRLFPDDVSVTLQAELVALCATGGFVIDAMDDNTPEAPHISLTLKHVHMGVAPAVGTYNFGWQVSPRAQAVRITLFYPDKGTGEFVSKLFTFQQ